MTAYLAPVRDMRFVLEELVDLDALADLPGYSDVSGDLVEAVLEEAARLAAEVLSPLNRTGDQQGVRIEQGAVREADGFADAYRTYIEGGWQGLACSSDYAGQGLPVTLSTSVQEMWQSANMAFALCPLLTEGAVDALDTHADDALKQRFLPKLVSGDWAGTMDLTESQAGSDLAAVSTRAVPAADHYLITGQKVFITWGDHGMTENIVHLVLARLPDAPPGVRGISLFLVPKYLVNEDGTPGRRNDVHPVSVEHKLGIHASPTCVMSFGDEGGAVGYLVGEPNRGLACMFTMMNHARVSVGVQGVAIAERAYQQARDYARQRVQGRAPGHQGRVTIIHHPDVRRMLLLMKSLTEASRAVGYLTGSSMDFSHRSTDAEQKALHDARLALLTPVLKAWATEAAQEVASLGVQVHGGMGYIEETGAAQHFRDARIATIYEGTTGIQAQDLAGRKIVGDGGLAARALIGEIRGLDRELAAVDGDAIPIIRAALTDGVDALERAVQWLIDNFQDDVHASNAVAVDLTMLFGTVVGGWQMARAALVVARRLSSGTDDSDFCEAKLITSRFYAEHVLPRAGAYLQSILAGSASMMALSDEQF
jgi:acyl-CoA dehydrogenase